MDDVVHDYLKCGDLKEGFARVRCTNPDCRNEYLLAFSCKGRWFCPSCLIKKVWEVDPLTCPRCGPEMKIISLIQDPDVIRQILKHLGLWKQDADFHK